jgi:hypothetical protein
VVEIAEELIESVHRREELIPITEMVLAELTADVAEGFQDVSDRRVFRLQAKIGSGQTNFG